MGRGRGVPQRQCLQPRPETARANADPGRVRRQLGAQLHRLVWHDAVVALLPDGGWMDGGCWMLAEALRRWLGDADLWIIGSARAPVDHVVARVGDWYLDGDGISSAQALLRRWRRVELRPAPFLRPFEPAPAGAAGIPYHPAVVTALTAVFAAHLDRPRFRAALGVAPQPSRSAAAGDGA